MEPSCGSRARSLRWSASRTITTSSIAGATRVTVSQANIQLAVFNTTDNIANYARTNRFLPNGSTAYNGNLIFAIGLGGNGGVSHTLLQRVANDPNQSTDNGVTYAAYPGYNSAQPIGTYVYAPTATELSAAFQKIASQILRLSK